MTRTPADQPATPREAAAVVLLSGMRGSEVLLIQRGPTLRFMPGHYVFPGGTVDADDTWAPVQCAPSDTDRRHIAAAVRECFEEAGVLLAEGCLPLPEELEKLRRALLAGDVSFPALLEQHQLTIDGSRFQPAGRWVTPGFSPIRFDTRFYLYQAAKKPAATAIPEDGEITAVDWVQPDTAREEWHRNTRKLSAPVAYVLQQLAALPVGEALYWLNAVPVDEDGVATCFEFRRGVQLLPLVSPTIPPATHTNTLLIGESEFLVIDPGAESVDERARLIERIKHLEALGGTLRAILVTHSHVDHVAAVSWLRAQRDVPVWAHEVTAERVDFPVDRHLTDGERISLAGAPGWELECLHTSGHDPGHLALRDRSTETLLAADLLANPGTIVISPEWDGDMTDYLNSLERCARLDFTLLIPGHGMPYFGGAGAEALRALVEHRLAREQRIREALEQGATTMDDILKSAYADVDESAWPLAKHQIRAHLPRLGIVIPESGEG